MFDNHIKSLIQLSREDKSSLKMPKMINFGDFFKKPKACGQTVLPVTSLLVQKVVKNAIISSVTFGIQVIFKHCVHFLICCANKLHWYILSN